MVSELENLLDLRRDAEDSARRVLASASRALVKEEEEQERMVERWRAAAATVEREAERLAASPLPSTAAQGRAREGYLARLRDEAARRKMAAEEHRTTTLAAAKAARDRALAHLERAVREREAVSRLRKRARAARSKSAARRAEDAASDLVSTNRRRTLRSGTNLPTG